MISQAENNDQIFQKLIDGAKITDKLIVSGKGTLIYERVYPDSFKS